MSLPACQQRALGEIEQDLQASEPHMTAMFAIFARLNGGAPVREELLSRSWLERVRYVFVLVPLLSVVIFGALFSGTAHGATTCGAGYGGGGIWTVDRTANEQAVTPPEPMTARSAWLCGI